MASASSFRPSSSSAPSIPQKSYDVFLSFRGEDTRYNFTDHLYNALIKRGIRTFRDDKLKRGEAVAPELLRAIEESRSSIIVFSENYAHSRWCLDELVKIMECQKDLGHTVFPIFYHVDPSHVRKQSGSFGEAFAGYEENWKDKVERWRTALTEAANLSGWHLTDGLYESDHIKKVIDSIFHQLNSMRFDVGTNLVGIDSHIKEMISLLDMESSDVRMVGIYGIGGIGKTTIAENLFNKLFDKFEYMSFLKNIREVSNTRDLRQLQKQLLGDMGEGSQNIKNDAHGASMIKNILFSKRVFIVLDDVDDSDQLEHLLGNREWLGEGSRVIITTRNKNLLHVQEVDDSYEVKGLNSKEAYELFSLHAFKQNPLGSSFIGLLNRVVFYCKGHPLALKVLGCLLFKKETQVWESELCKLEREPESKIHNVLKRSYDGLDHREKKIFLDVACFFKSEDRDFVSRILDGCHGNAEIGIKNLNDKCLITFSHNQICMHDLIQQMGWEVVRENFPNDPDKWSRLWDPRDIERALRTCEGIKRVETISLDLSKLKRVRFNSNVFAKMTGLRLLKVHSSSDFNFNFNSRVIEEVVMKNASKMQLGLDLEFPSYELRYLYWDGYPLHILPSTFDGENLVELHLQFSNIKQLWQGNKDLGRLKVIDLSYSKKLVQMPKFSSMSNLETLILKGCVSLIDIHPSVGVLKKLTTLILSNTAIAELPSGIGYLESLNILDLSYCSKFEKFPEIQGNMRSLQKLYLNETAIRELPSGIDLESVVILDLSDCSKFEKFPEDGANMKSLSELYLVNTAIKELPTGIANWKSLQILDLNGCSNFEKFPEIWGNMRSLRDLYLKETAIRELPSGIDLESVEILDLSDCSKFEKFPEDGANMKSLSELNLVNTAIKELPTGIANWKSLLILNLNGCLNFEKFPEIQGNMRSLRKLYLEETAIRELPSGIDLESVETLDLSDCSKFEKFPEDGANMKRLRKLYLTNTATKELPTGIANWESLELLHLDGCSNFEKFPEIQGNMRSLQELYLSNTAIRELPSGIDLESVEILDLSYCSKFEKFPEDGANMKSLMDLRLKNTAIKELPTGIANWESLPFLDLSECPSFEKFPEIQGNMRSLQELYLSNTAIRELPSGIGYLESLNILDLSYCSKFEKFLEMKRSMKDLCKLDLRWTAIEELPSSIQNLSGLRWFYIGGCKNLRSLKLPSSLEEIDAYDCRSKEDFSSLLWLCHLNWLKSVTEELKCWKLSAVIPFPESSGIPGWIGDQNLGSEASTELRMNWYEDPNLLGFVVSCVYQPIPKSADDPRPYHLSSSFVCNLNLHGNGFGLKDKCQFEFWCECHGNLNDQVWVWWYPKIAIPKEYHHKFTHFSASFETHVNNVKKCGINLIFAGDEHKHKPMLLDHLGNSGDNGSALQDTNGNVLSAQDDEHNRNLGDNGSVVLEESNGNRKRSRDNSLPHAVEEPQYKRLAAPDTNLSL